MIDLEQLELKKLNKNGLKTLVGWAKTEGWNPGEHDYEVFWKTDTEGYCGFYIEDELIAGGAVVSYQQEFGFMGLFIVRPDLRGQGIGKKIWFLRRDLLLKRLHKGASIGMDGVVAMQPFYERGGFKTAFKDERYEFIGQKSDLNRGISVVETDDFIKLKPYDLVCFGYNRATFLESWLKIPNSRAFKFSENASIKGYAVIRKANSGFRIGPLFADDDLIAEALFKACLNSVVGEPVYLDIPVINKGAMDLVKKYKGVYTFECARMYYGDKPNMNMNKIYGITTYELG